MVPKVKVASVVVVLLLLVRAAAAAVAVGGVIAPRLTCGTTSVIILVFLSWPMALVTSSSTFSVSRLASARSIERFCKYSAVGELEELVPRREVDLGTGTRYWSSRHLGARA